MAPSKIIFSLLSLFVLTRLILANEIRYCDKTADYDVKVHEVEISPDPIARGQPATFNISASTEKSISGGKMVIDVSYFGWHVHSETHDFCEETSCPVSSGDFAIAHSQVLPSFTPPGSYSLKMTIVDENKYQLSCIGFDFSIGFAASSTAAI
ncbi:hypothetical protein Nepgr_024825 [Nepenthes gracilis]|uniref:MD-2-related lipid-recognition domain-containing protein n=1 Tax=Nepenthes gracilis TaxID=150966 RepID=A0AAD3T6P4_NEPGR|nr:hypothetical protein Nepgr_024825 [Nepenthes gracilis]